VAADLRHFWWRVVAAVFMVAVWTLALLVEAGVILTLVAVAVLALAHPVSADDDSLVTLTCETVAPFVERNTSPVTLSAGGHFRINDVLSPRPPADCATPVLLIRSGQGGSWLSLCAC
jgi:hypothetical protein